MSTPTTDPHLHPFAVGDLVVTTASLSVGYVESGDPLCPEGETLQIVGLSGNPEYPISVCKPNDPFWRCGVRAHEIQPLQQHQSLDAGVNTA